MLSTEIQLLAGEKKKKLLFICISLLSEGILETTI